MRTRLAEVGPTFLTQVREICEQGRLDDTFVDALCEPAEVYTYGAMIAHLLTFAAHRRVLVAGALHDAGITDLGNGDPMRSRMLPRVHAVNVVHRSCRTPRARRPSTSAR